MVNKVIKDAVEALQGLQDGAVVLVGGFAEVGQPRALIDALIEQGATDLVLVHNNAGVGQLGLAKLLELGRVRKVICSFPRSAGSQVFQEMYKEKKVELELVPQGTLAERIRAAGAGIAGFYTPTAAGTMLAEGKESREFNGRPHVFESALPGDLALLEAECADRWGNLTYKRSGRNFNPIMAMAARLTIAQAAQVVDLGELDPEIVVTPSIFVDKVVYIPEGGPLPRGN